MKFRAALALLLAGSAFFSGACGGKVKKGVVVDGVAVGGLPYAEAAALVREKRYAALPPFTVHTPEGDETFTLDFSDDLDFLLRSAKRGEELSMEVRAEWVDAEEALSALCGRCCRAAEDATLSFSAAGFSYRAEQNGRACDGEGLLRDVFAALASGRYEATLHTFSFPPEVTLSSLKERTRLLASYSTVFDGGNRARAGNIALAAERISGSILLPGETFSFNETVGKRTAENGFSEAPVISGGEFVQGVGGGVCQASTTLMNAALRAGLRVIESHPHSLSVGYVPPSLDAMVSEGADLRFQNPYSVPVYILGKAEGGRVRFSVFGLPDGRTYRTESKVLLRVDPPPEQIVEGEEDRWVRSPKQGVASESYLLVYEGEKLLSRTLLRRDVYAVVQGIREKKPEEKEDVPPDGEQEKTAALRRR